MQHHDIFHLGNHPKKRKDYSVQEKQVFDYLESRQQETIQLVGDNFGTGQNYSVEYTDGDKGNGFLQVFMLGDVGLVFDRIHYKGEEDRQFRTVNLTVKIASSDEETFERVKKDLVSRVDGFED